MLGEKGCVSFTTHYIGIKRKEDEGEPVVVGFGWLEIEVGFVGIQSGRDGLLLQLLRVYLACLTNICGRALASIG